jgi:hypothetical protein
LSPTGASVRNEQRARPWLAAIVLQWRTFQPGSPIVIARMGAWQFPLLWTGMVSQVTPSFDLIRFRFRQSRSAYWTSSSKTNSSTALMRSK